MEQQSRQSLALFDFDGTLTTKDSLLGFLLYVYGWKRVLVGAFFLLSSFVLYAVKLISNHEAKSKVIRFFFAGETYQFLKKKGIDYGRDELPKILRAEAMDRLIWHKQQGHRVVIVTASSELWLESWCCLENLELIATKYQVRDGVLNGNYDGLNCHGLEKVRRIKEEIALDDYDEVYAYGDTKGDLPMLGLASKPYYKVFV